MARTLLSPLLLALACGDDPPKDRKPEPETCADTWDSVGEPFLRTWCNSCHSSALTGDQRYGAPVGVDFDTLALARIWSGRIEVRALADPPTMPPEGGVPAADIERFAAWLECGMPGETTPPAVSCAAPVEHAGSAAVASQADADRLCSDGTAVTGDLVVTGAVELGCVCSVGGSVTVAGDEVALTALAQVGGDLVVQAPARVVSLPALVSVGGNATASGVATLAELDLSSLDQVGLDFVAEGLPVLADLRTPRLADVGGSFRVVDALALEAVDLSRLTTVGQDVVIEANPAMGVLLGEGYALETVGGDLVLADLDAWYGFYGFGNLRTVGGDLRISDHATVERLLGFTLLDEIGGTIELHRNLALVAIDGFDNLDQVGGGISILENPVLAEEEGFSLLREVGGTIALERNPRLTSIDGLARPERIGGLSLERNDDLSALPTFEALTEITGDLRIDANAVLQDVTGLAPVEVLGGDLTITGNASLSTAEANALRDAIEVIGGAVTISGNAP